MSKTIHALAGATALGLILVFWFATLLSELFAGTQTVVMVKTLIPWGFILLVPALMAAGASGFSLGRTRQGALVDAKRKRMPIIALNGLFVLAPSALFLASRAQTGLFDAGFYTVQGLELVAGALNAVLLAMNLRDGLRLAGRWK